MFRPVIFCCECAKDMQITSESYTAAANEKQAIKTWLKSAPFNQVYENVEPRESLFFALLNFIVDSGNETLKEMDFFKAFKGEPNVTLIFYYVVNRMKELIDQDALGKVDEEWIGIIKDWQKSNNKTPENAWRTFRSFTGDIPCDFFDKWCLKAIHEYFQISIMIYVPVVDLVDNTAFEQPAQDKDRSLLFQR